MADSNNMAGVVMPDGSGSVPPPPAAGGDMGSGSVSSGGTPAAGQTGAGATAPTVAVPALDMSVPTVPGGGSGLPQMAEVEKKTAGMGGGRANAGGGEKKKGKGKLIAGVLVAVLLVAGLGTGLVLQGRQIVFKQRAADAGPCGNPGAIECRADGHKYWCNPANGRWDGPGDACTPGGQTCVISGYSCVGTTCMAHNALLGNGTCGDVPSTASNCPNSCQPAAPTSPPANVCDSSATTAAACRDKPFGFNTGLPCTCTRTTGSVCACVSNTGCTGVGMGCFTGSACSVLNRNVMNGGAGCGAGRVCCSTTTIATATPRIGGPTSPATPPSPTPVGACPAGSGCYGGTSCPTGTASVNVACGTSAGSGRCCRPANPTGLPNGSPCSSNAVCQYNYCQAGRCAYPPTVPTTAPSTPTPTPGGQCLYDHNCPSNMTCIGVKCQLKFGPGIPCTHNGNCQSNSCVDHICVASALGRQCSSSFPCPTNMFCPLTGIIQGCQLKKIGGEFCAGPNECISNNCSLYRCGVIPTITVAPTTTSGCPAGYVCRQIAASTCGPAGGQARSCTSGSVAGTCCMPPVSPTPTSAPVSSDPCSYCSLIGGACGTSCNAFRAYTRSCTGMSPNAYFAACLTDCQAALFSWAQFVCHPLCTNLTQSKCVLPTPTPYGSCPSGSNCYGGSCPSNLVDTGNACGTSAGSGRCCRSANAGLCRTTYNCYPGTTCPAGYIQDSGSSAITVCGTSAGSGVCCSPRFGGGSPTPTPRLVYVTPRVTATPGAGACAGVKAPCNNVSGPFCCTGQNLVCTPDTANNNICNQTAPGGSGDAKCGTGSVCSGKYLGFKCISLTASGECLDNRQVFTTYAAARAYAASGGCGQVDTVCNGGAKDGTLCGGFEVIKNGCVGGGGGGPTSPPVGPTNPPANTPTTATGVAQCQQVQVLRNGVAASNIRIGDNLTFKGFGATSVLGDSIDKMEFVLKRNGVAVLTQEKAATKSGSIYIGETTYSVTQGGTYTVTLRVHSVKQGWRD